MKTPENGSTEYGLEVSGISHAYGPVRAVDGVSLKVATGELLCLLGPSGCGKTTLLRVVAGLEPLQAGQVVLGGRVVADERVELPPEERGVGMVFQDYALFPHLSVLDNVAFGLRGGSRHERQARAREALDQVNLADLARAYPHTLSGGQQQRVALARAIAPRPHVMLLDEPFSGLDARLREQVRLDALRVLRTSGAAVVMVTHDPREALAMGDRVAIMRSGRIEQIGTPSDVYFQSASAFVARFLTDANVFSGVVAGGHVATPLGPAAVEHLEDGEAAEVLVRTEALRVYNMANCDVTNAVEAVVQDVHLLGPTTVLVLSVPDSSGRAYEVRARQMSPCPFVQGQIVQVSIESRGAQIFRAGEPQPHVYPGLG